MSRIGSMLLLLLLFTLHGCAFENGAPLDKDRDMREMGLDYAADQGERAAAAREVAFQSKNGMLPLMPELYWGRYMYYPSAGSGCYVTVTEKDLNREEVGIYEINVCEDEK